MVVKLSSTVMTTASCAGITRVKPGARIRAAPKPEKPRTNPAVTATATSIRKVQLSTAARTVSSPRVTTPPWRAARADSKPDS